MTEYFPNIPVEQFIKEVINLHLYGNKKPEEIAKQYSVSIVVINRIIKMYDKKKQKSLLALPSPKWMKPKELKDKARKDTEKITEEDIKDLIIDLKLFEQGKEPDEK